MKTETFKRIAEETRREIERQVFDVKNYQDTGWAFDRAVSLLGLKDIVDQWSSSDFDEYMTYEIKEMER